MQNEIRAPGENFTGLVGEGWQEETERDEGGRAVGGRMAEGREEEEWEEREGGL